MFLSVLALGLALELGYFPDTVAVEKEDFPDHALRTLREAGIVADGEDVLYFYGGGMFDYLEDGNLFTDRRVVSYWSQGGEVVIEAASYAEVADISADYSDNMWVDSEVTVTRSDGTEFLLVVSTDEGGDRAFVRSLEREWRRRR
jgi:hypothetical protein